MKWMWIFLLLWSEMADASTTSIEVVIKGARSDEGYIGASLFAVDQKDGFPGSAQNARATHYAKISEGRRFAFTKVPQGTYALAIIHDENGDKKANMFLGIPREGFGFSNNPTIYFGPPSFEKASFRADKDTVVIEVEVKYIL